jgi:hypothetical protein
MGASFDYRTYLNESPQKCGELFRIDSEKDQFINGDEYTGTIAMNLNNPRFLDRESIDYVGINWLRDLYDEDELHEVIFGCVEDATDFIKEWHKKWEIPLAVRISLKLDEFNSVNGYVIGGWCSG